MRRLLLLIVLFTSAAVAAGCNQMMNDEPRYKPLAASDFFSDGQSARPQVPGTIAHGHVRANQALYTGRMNGALVERAPVPVTEALVARGQERFDIFCSPCHGRLGNGDGTVVERGFQTPPSYHSNRLRKAPLGHFFEVMTLGFGAMPSYASRVSPDDRWAIAEYIRALQLSQLAMVVDVPEDGRRLLESAR